MQKSKHRDNAGSKKKKKKRERGERGGSERRQSSAFLEAEVKQIGEYRVRQRIGKGAFGSVYMVTSLQTAKTHAIKRINTTGTPQAELDAIEMEIKLLQCLDHPNIVRYIEVIPEPSSGYLNIVLELCDQGSLASILKDLERFPENMTCRYVSQVLAGLDYLHNQGVIHRDIKGANILSDKWGNVKLADFGVATKLKGSSPDSELPAGTTYWMAPEIVKMTGQLSTACDIWSLGSTIIELLTGQPPYFDLPMMSACFRIVQDDHPPLPPGISENCKSFLMSCFQKDPQRRLDASMLLKHEWLKNSQASADVKSADVKGADVKGAGKGDVDVKVAVDLKAPPALGQKLSVPVGSQPASKTDSMRTAASQRSEGKGSEVKGSSSAGGSRRQPLVNNWAADQGPPVKAESGGGGGDGGDSGGGSGDGGDFPDFDLSGFPADDDDGVGGGGGGGQGGQDGAVTAGAGLGDLSMMVGEKSLDKYVERDDDGGFDDMELDIGAGGDDAFGEFELGDQVLELEFDDDEDGPKELDKNAALLTALQFNFNELEVHQDETSGAAHEAKNERKILAALENLSRLVEENPGVIGQLVNDLTLGMIAMFDLLTSEKETVVNAVIKFINDLLYDERKVNNSPRGTKFQQSICTIGVISQINKFVSPRYSVGVRTHASNFVKHFCTSNEYTRKMFIACGGLDVLIRPFLYEDYNGEDTRPIILSSVDCIVQLFEIKSNPKNDICRLFCKLGLLPRLAKLFKLLVHDRENPDTAHYTNRVVKIFSLFSGGDVKVRRKIAERGVLKYLIPELPRLKFDNLFNLMKMFHRVCGVKNEKSMKQMVDCGAIQQFVKLLDHPRMEIHNQVILCLEMLLKGTGGSNQEMAVKAGIVPHIKKIILRDMLLKQVALSIITNLPIEKRASVRAELKKHRMVDFYLNVLSDPCWSDFALGCLKLWISAEPRRIGFQLTTSMNFPKIVAVCTRQATNEQQMKQILEHMHSMCDKSAALVTALARSSIFVTRLVERLREPVTGRNSVGIKYDSLRIMRKLCACVAITDKSTDLREFAEKYGVIDALRTMIDSSVKAKKEILHRFATVLLTDIDQKIRLSQLRARSGA